MMAFKRKTGQEVWKTPLESKNVCYSVPFIYEPKGGKPELVCTCTGNGMFSLDPLTGIENWSINDGLFQMRTVASPITVAGLIFGSNGSGAYASNYVVAVRPGIREFLHNGPLINIEPSGKRQPEIGFENFGVYQVFETGSYNKDQN